MPVTLDTTVTTDDGVTFVTARVRNTERVDRRVRLANRLDGPVLPPRRHGRSERGWSEEGFVGVVAAESDRAVGYACRASPAAEKPAVELVSVDDPADHDADPVDHALATLGDARPPADVVPFDGDGVADEPPDDDGVADALPAAVRERPTADGERSSGSGVPDESSDAHDTVVDRSRGTDITDQTADGGADPSTDLPPAVVRYLAAVDARIDRADALASGTVGEATAALEAGVDPAGIDRLLAADAAALSRLADRATALAARAEATAVPTDALDRLGRPERPA